MKRFVLFLTALCVACATQPATDKEVDAWRRRAREVTIIRDDWGIAHIHGKTDADAVFGMLYAQAEDDFNRVETNYINSMGRLSETAGESEVYRDLRMKLFIDPVAMKAQYEQSPEWLKALMNAFADALNYYLHEHPEVKPRVIKRFEPWMALTFSEGSIGGDIERINLRQLEAFYGKDSQAHASRESSFPDQEPRGSNGFAIAPANTANGHTLMLINPHTSFYFRAELQVASDEQLNAYGAVTWGQFFVYQGFNERAGWMHTSSGVDNIDEYLETVVKHDAGLFCRCGPEERPITATLITVPYKSDSGMARKEFTIYRTHHGPIVREADGKWVSVRLMQEPVKALTQSYMRIKAKDYKSFRQTMELHTNSSNNTVFADADGNIAYFHSNFIPKRDTRFDWTHPVDGSDPATEWDRPLSIDETPGLLNPANGWLYNCNNAPWSAAGANSPAEVDFPAYVETGGENPRGLHAIRVLANRKDFTIDSLIMTAFDSYLTEFEALIPTLLAAWDQLPVASPMKTRLSGQIELLRRWDLRWSVQSIPTTLAVFWGEELWRQANADPRMPPSSVYEYMATRITPQQRLEALASVSDKLTADFGTWKTPWGDVNRFQRLTGDIVQPFDDKAPSIPVGFTSAIWGSLASFGARVYPGTKKLYGTSGNSFVAAVEFGPTVRARAVTAGGASGDAASAHFNDQATRYTTGALRDVYFHRRDLEGHIERQYHPGE